MNYAVETAANITFMICIILILSDIGIAYFKYKDKHNKTNYTDLFMEQLMSTMFIYAPAIFLFTTLIILIFGK